MKIINKGNLSYQFYYQLFASESPVKIDSAVPEISWKKQTIKSIDYQRIDYKK